MHCIAAEAYGSYLGLPESPQRNVPWGIIPPPPPPSSLLPPPPSHSPVKCVAMRCNALKAGGRGRKEGGGRREDNAGGGGKDTAPLVLATWRRLRGRTKIFGASSTRHVATTEEGRKHTAPLYSSRGDACRAGKIFSSTRHVATPEEGGEKYCSTLLVTWRRLLGEQKYSSRLAT